MTRIWRTCGGSADNVANEMESLREVELANSSILFSFPQKFARVIESTGVCYEIIRVMSIDSSLSILYRSANNMGIVTVPV